VIRVVLAVVVSAALLGIGLPAAEQAERDRNAALAAAELERLAGAAERLAAENDPVEPGRSPAGATLELDVPAPTFAEPGRIRIGDDRLRWVHRRGRNRTVVPAVPIRAETPIVATGRLRIRLTFVRRGDASAVRVRALDGVSRPSV
jgi:hypothetical protein